MIGAKIGSTSSLMRITTLNKGAASERQRIIGAKSWAEEWNGTEKS
jgi:hypothetical protein